MYGVGLNGTLDQPARVVQREFQRHRQLFDAGAGRLDVERAGRRETRRSEVRRTTPSTLAAWTMRSRRDQVLRLNFNGSRFIRENTGIGNFDSIERAYSSEDSNFGLFLQQNGPLGRRFVLNTRLSIFGNDSTARSALEAPTIIVNDAFTSGGAQRRGGSHAPQLLAQFGSRLRAGHSLDAHRRRSAVRNVPDRLGQQLSRHLCLRGPHRVRGRAGRAAITRRIGDPPGQLHEHAGRPVHPGRHQGPQGTHDHRRRALRASDPRAGQAEFRAASRLHLGAVQERQDHAPRQLGHVL